MKAYLYSGPGASKKSLLQTEKMLSYFFARVEPLFPEELIHGAWENDAALLILPGGADIPYTHKLNGAGNKRIRSFVEGGGKLLGICAGSYFSGAFVDFARGSENEVQGVRELAFFPGTVSGPVYGPYDYRSEAGARACTIICEDTPIVVYFNGGGYFVDASAYENTTVLATYEDEKAAIIECRVGLGSAILSGVHFEYDDALLDRSDSYLEKIVPALHATREQRIQLVHYLLERLVKASSQ